MMYIYIYTWYTTIYIYMYMQSVSNILITNDMIWQIIINKHFVGLNDIMEHNDVCDDTLWSSRSFWKQVWMGVGLGG